MKTRMNRRRVLAGAAAGAASLVILRHSPSAWSYQANERLSVAVVGVGKRGTYHVGAVGRIGQDLVAVCDANQKHVADVLKNRPKVRKYQDFRKMLDEMDRQLDAVIVATPDHTHAVIAATAMKRGKHVYVEKPACCTIEEGKAMVAAARKNNVSVQVGSQGRSQPDCHAACTYVRNGMLGKISRVTCWHYASPGDDNPVPDCDPPKELDWDLWLGPMRWRPYNPRYLHGVFRWLLESGGGQIRDRGAHVMSCALYLMDSDQTGPVTIEAKGTAPSKGLWDSAVEMEVTYTFKDPDWTLVWAQPGDKPPKGDQGHNDYGAVYHGDKDKLILYGGDGGTWTERKAREFKVPAGGKEIYKSPGHKEDWFAGIRTGKKTIMNIEAGAATANLTVLGNISFVLGRKIQWDPVKQEIVGDDLARRMMCRPQRFPYHL